MAKTSKFFKIPNAIIRNNAILNTSKMLYMVFKNNTMPDQNRIYLPLNINGLLATVGYNVASKNAKLIKEALAELLEINVIEVYSDVRFTERLDLDCAKPSTNFFVQLNEDYVYSDEFVDRFVAEDEIDKQLIKAGINFTAIYTDQFIDILTIGFDGNRGNLIAAYSVILSRALIGDKSDKYSSLSMEEIAQYTGINTKTIQTYTKFLYDAHLLFKVTIRHVAKTGTVRDHNVYTRWADRFQVGFAILTDKWFKDKTLIKIGDNDVDDNAREKFLKMTRREFQLSY